MSDTPKKASGRPSLINEEQRTQLLLTLSHGANVGQACMLAGVSRSTYYRYLETHPEFQDQVNDMKGALRFAAEAVIHKTITEEESASAAQWYLKHRHSQDYNTKADPGMNQDPQAPLHGHLAALLDKIDEIM